MESDPTKVVHKGKTYVTGIGLFGAQSAKANPIQKILALIICNSEARLQADSFRNTIRYPGVSSS